MMQKNYSKLIEDLGIYWKDADVAQLAEPLICNQLVGGSSPSIGSLLHMSVHGLND